MGETGDRKEDKGEERGRKGSSCGPKNAIFFTFWGSGTPAFVDRSGPNLVCESIYRRTIFGLSSRRR